MIRIAIALLFGAGVGVAGTFLHNAYRPVGLVVALTAVALGAYLVREMYRSRLHSLLFALGWIFVIVRASTLGNGGEILIQSNGYGNILVIGGALTLLIFALRFRSIN